jgi:DNA-binding response OmpR family regulator
MSEWEPVTEGMRILVVDDEPDVCRGIAEFLEQQDYRVTCAGGAGDALLRLDEAPCDLVISDIRMPEIDGMELLRRVRKGWPATAFILMTAYGSKETAIEAIRAGAYDYIEKPFDVAELANATRNCLRNAALRRQNESLVERLQEEQRILERRVEEKTREVLDHERKLARVETLRQALTTLAHYINNANGAIWSYADFCKASGKDFPQEARRLVDICMKEGGKVTAVIQSLQEVVEQMDLRSVPYIPGSERTMFDIEKRIEEKISARQADGGKTR